jgi:hypothetical protein
MKTIYIARLKENEPCLVKAQFVQDTRKAIYVENGTAEVILIQEKLSMLKMEPLK